MRRSRPPSGRRQALAHGSSQLHGSANGTNSGDENAERVATSIDRTFFCFHVP
jgi:hypothetical protein